MNHSIGQISVKVNCPSAEQAFGMKEEITQKFSGFIESDLSDEFDRLSDDKDLIMIPRIEIELGKVKINELYEILRFRFTPLLEEQILKAKSEFLLKKKAGEFPGTFSAEPFYELQFDEVIIRNEPEHYIEMLSFYLENGFLPFHFSLQELKKKTKQHLSEGGQELIFKILALLSTEIRIKRFSALLSFDDTFPFVSALLESVLDKLTSPGRDFILAFKDKIFLNQLFRFTLRNEEDFISALIFYFIQVERGLSEMKIKAETRLESLKEENEAAFLWQLFIKSFDVAPENQNKVIQLIKKYGIIPEKEWGLLKKIFLYEDSGLIELPVEVKDDEKSIKHSFSKTLEDGIMVENAGIILLHPFIQGFFNNLDLLNENGLFIDEEKNARAILLLDWLANGEGRSPEPDLFFFKILTGWEKGKFISLKNMVLSEKELLECNDLLDSVILHWKVLKSTSSGGLRQSFLKRRGRLRFSDKGWELKIQRESFDVLLDHLPWSYSVVKYDWMKEIIFTEW